VMWYIQPLTNLEEPNRYSNLPQWFLDTDLRLIEVYG